MPTNLLKIGGELISDIMLMSVEVTQELNQHTWCAIECRQTQDARLDVEGTLGKDLQVFTYDQDGAEVRIFDGFILEGEVEYEIFGAYTARLKGVSRSYKLECTPQEAYWRKKTLRDVAQALAGEDGLDAVVQCAQKPARNYVQWGETDFAFLTRIADDHQAWIRPTSGGIEIRDSFQNGATVRWRKESDGLVSFRVKGRLAQPSFQGTHYNARTMTSTTLRKIQKGADFTGASGPMVDAVQSASQAMLPSGHVHTDGRAATEQEFQETLERESMRAIGSSIVGFGISRNAQLKPGDLVQIEGNLDARGSYGLIRVVHHWTRTGYTNEFCCTPWTGYISATPPKPQRIYGMVTGRVTDNNDPRKMGRLQVQYDWLEDGATAWARMATPHAGGDRGFLFLPEVGDEVLIAFEHGDPERPYIVGSLWNGVDQAPRQEFWGSDVDPNDIKRIVTKSGHRIQFSDKEGKEAIVVATPNNLKISLLENTDETGRPMILLHATGGDIVFSAPDGRIHFQSKYFSREVGQPQTQTQNKPVSRGVAVQQASTSRSPSGFMATPNYKSSFDVHASDSTVIPSQTSEGYSKGVIVSGSADFRNRTKEALDRLKALPTGQAVLKDIENSGKSVTITGTDEENGGCYPINPDAAIKRGGRNGVGSDSTISFNPSFKPDGLPNEVVLGHEMIHAQHNARGMRADSGEKTDGVKNEELQTVGLPPYPEQGMTENSIRSDLKIGMRTKY